MVNSIPAIHDSPKVVLLRTLENEKGTFVSGERLSRQLGISRTAVWKHIEELRRQGYVVDSLAGKGHRLISSPDSLTPPEIWKRLNTSLLGQEIHCYPRLDSTQDAAFRLAQRGAPEGTLVVAQEQVMGRGRLGRTYFCPRGGLWFSLLLRPSLRPELVVPITLMVGVAIAEVLKESFGLSSTLKWPNDVLVQDRKVAGILMEMVAESDMVRFAICGIGLNVNIPTDAFPPGLGTLATSILAELGHEVSLPALLCRSLEGLERHYFMLLKEGPAPVINAWRQWPNILGKRVSVTSPRGPVEGVAEELDNHGALLVRTDEGLIERVIAGDVYLARA